MNGIIYLVGVIVIIMFILSFLGLVLNGTVGFFRRRILFWDAAAKAEAAELAGSQKDSPV